jgi:cbb3-type cytochrome c oxidase subunit III
MCWQSRGRSMTRRWPRRGATVFADNCAACHGDDGKGDRDQGAPNLTDAIWLYGGAPRR